MGSDVAGALVVAAERGEVAEVIVVVCAVVDDEEEVVVAAIAVPPAAASSMSELGAGATKYSAVQLAG